MIKGLAPGTILQFMFIQERLQKHFSSNSKFIEVGSGNGDLSKLLLNIGFEGTGVDLNQSACTNNENLNKLYISTGKYKVFNNDFSEFELADFDFLISSMVIEHIDSENLKLFIAKAKKCIRPEGKLIFLVPSNMDAWGIEDEIAGHVMRYTFEKIDKLASDNELNVVYKCGLNYPISNWLLRVSNYIVSRKESNMKDKTMLEKTVYTGNRNVKFKTTFPRAFNLVLNEIVLLPFYWLQKLNYKNRKSLIMYFELSLK